VERGIRPAVLFSAKTSPRQTARVSLIDLYPRARGDAAQNVHGRFLRSEDFLLQNCATLRNAARVLNREIPSVRNAVQRSETMRNSLGLN